MKPGQIQVFDGLRLTTEHINHLQEALRSGVEDIRGILGLGMVHSGFKVTTVGSGTVTVQPGLAFDWQKNRLLADEPTTVQISFDPGSDAQFVCLKYEQVEDLKVEGQFTLIYDSCSVVLRPTLPQPKDNLVPIAQVTQADGGLTVTELGRPEMHGHAHRTPDTDAGATGNGRTDPGSPAAPSGTAGEAAPTAPTETTPAAAGTPPAPAPAQAPGPNGAATAGTDGTGSVTPTAPTTGTEAGAPDASAVEASGPGAPVVRQGVERLVGEAAGIDLAALLGGPLRNALAAGNRPDTELRFNLFDTGIPLDFPVLSLTSQTALSASVQVDRGSSTATPAPANQPPPPAESAPAGATPVRGNEGGSAPTTGAALRARAAAQGEATFAANGAIAQYALSTVQLWTGDAPAPTWTPELTEGGIAHLPFVSPGTATAPAGTVEEALQHVQILIRVDRGTAGALKLIGNLLWIGETSNDMIGSMQTHQPTLTWDGFLGWKAFGTEQMPVKTT